MIAALTSQEFIGLVLTVTSIILIFGTLIYEVRSKKRAARYSTNQYLTILSPTRSYSAVVLGWQGNALQVISQEIPDSEMRSVKTFGVHPVPSPKPVQVVIAHVRYSCKLQHGWEIHLVFDILEPTWLPDIV